MKHPRRFAVGICCFLLSFGVFLFVLEAVLAVADLNTKSNVRFVPGKGITYLPHAYYRHTKEGFSEGYFNSHGFRDYERTYAKPTDTFRIVILGDSYTEGLQVALENTFPALLESQLNAKAGSIKFEVLNLGQSGFGTADEYMRYLNFATNYHPDLVILAFLTGNDIRNNSKVLNGEQLGFYFYFDKKGNLLLDRSLIDQYEQSLTLPKRMFQFAARNSYLVSLVSERFYLLRLQVNDYRSAKLLAAEDPLLINRAVDELSDSNIYLPNMSDHWREAFDITRALLRMFRVAVEANGQKFLLVTLSNAVQLDPQMQARLKAQYTVSFDFEQPDRIIADFADKENINHLKLMPLFREYHVRTGKILHGFGSRESGHWNEVGHRFAAEKIFEFLRERHLVP